MNPAKGIDAELKQSPDKGDDNKAAHSICVERCDFVRGEGGRATRWHTTFVFKGVVPRGEGDNTCEVGSGLGWQLSARPDIIML
jgi:hypothetical protein